MKFSFESLEIYHISLDWVKQVDELIDKNRAEISRTLADQFFRAALSIPLNIAEGNGRWHKEDKRNLLWIARGSVFECVPIIEILVIKGLISDLEHEVYHNRLELMGRMLSGLIKAHDGPKSLRVLG